MTLFVPRQSEFFTLMSSTRDNVSSNNASWQIRQLRLAGGARKGRVAYITESLIHTMQGSTPDVACTPDIGGAGVARLSARA